LGRNERIKAFVNGRIYAKFKPLRIVSGMVFAGDMIVYSGDSDRAKKIARELGGETVDLQGRTVLPGFVDAHVHLGALGLLHYAINLQNLKSIEGVKKAVLEYRERYPQARVVIGFGWDQERFAEGRWPNKEDVDSVSKDVPVVLIRACGHAALLNSVALEILGEQLKSLPSDFVARDTRARPTGLVFEEAVEIAREKFVELVGGRKDMLLRGIEHACSLGVTSIGFMSASLNDFKALQELLYEGVLRARVHVYFKHSEYDTISKVGFRKGYGHDMLVINGIKLFADGSLGARTAFLSEDYSDAPGWRGKLLLNERELTRLLEDIVGNRLQPAIHAIGDGALDVALKAIKLAGASHVGCRIEHASIARGDQIQAMSACGVKVVVQPRFVVSDWWAVNRIGLKRVSWLYPFRTMMNSGIELGISTDAPIEPLNPWLTVEAATLQEGLWGARESLDVESVLHLYTVGSARALGRLDIGVLEEGFKADFIIVDKDPMVLPTNRVREISVLEAYVGGVRVY